MTSSSQFAYYTAFVIHITALFCIAAVYLYGYRFLEDRFYVPLAIGWLVNAIYLILETCLFMLRDGPKKTLSFSLFTAAAGLTSIPFFHRAVQVRSQSKGEPWYRPFVFGALPITICIAGGFWVNAFPVGNAEYWYFALFTFPAAAYSAIVLLAVARSFFLIFPEDDYGKFASLLYGSWTLYAILQFFYPFKLFPQIDDFFLLLFFLAFTLKIGSSVALLSVLREYYLEAAAASHDSSVLADLGNLAAGLHHDLATPIGRIDSEIALLAQARNSDRVVMQHIEGIRKPLSLIHSAIRFVDLMRHNPEHAEESFRRINVKEPVEFAIGLFRKRFPQAGFRIVPLSARQKNYYIRANKEVLSEAFLNIYKNAWESSAKLLRISIRKSRVRENFIEIVFSNDGRLLTDQEKKLAFKAGWSTKHQGEGTANIGMGMYMCSRIVGMHGGNVTLSNDDIEGLVVVLVALPARKQM